MQTPSDQCESVEAWFKSSGLESEHDLIEILGRGSFGTVVKTWHRSLSRFEAIKFINPDVFEPTAHKRFLLEAQSLSRLDHPNIVKVYKFGGLSDGTTFMTMEFAEGKSLSSLLEELGPLDIEDFKSVFIQASKALEVLRVNGIVHRDIKPANIIVANANGRLGVVKLVDFGVSKQNRRDASGMEQNLTGLGWTVGTPAYMSPEQCRGEPMDARSDIYALGCVMYESLTGESVFKSANQMEIMTMHSSVPPVPPSERSPERKIPASFDQIVLCALEKDPQCRFDTPHELLQRLERADLARIAEVRKEPSSPSFKNVAVASGSLLVIIAIAFWCIWPLRTAHQSLPSTARADNSIALFRDVQTQRPLLNTSNKSDVRRMLRICDAALAKQKDDSLLDKRQLVRLLEIRSEMLMSCNQLKDAEKAAMEAFQFAKENGVKPDTGTSVILLTCADQLGHRLPVLGAIMPQFEKDRRKYYSDGLWAGEMNEVYLAARMFCNAGDIDSALSLLQRCEAAPDHGSERSANYFASGQIQLLLGNYKDAYKAFEKSAVEKSKGFFFSMDGPAFMYRAALFGGGVIDQSLETRLKRCSAPSQVQCQMLKQAKDRDWDGAALSLNRVLNAGEDVQNYFSSFLDWDLRHFAKLCQASGKVKLAERALSVANRRAAASRKFEHDAHLDFDNAKTPRL